MLLFELTAAQKFFKQNPDKIAAFEPYQIRQKSRNDTAELNWKQGRRPEDELRALGIKKDSKEWRSMLQSLRWSKNKLTYDNYVSMVASKVGMRSVDVANAFDEIANYTAHQHQKIDISLAPLLRRLTIVRGVPSKVWRGMDILPSNTNYKRIANAKVGDKIKLSFPRISSWTGHQGTTSHFVDASDDKDAIGVVLELSPSKSEFVADLTASSVRFISPYRGQQEYLLEPGTKECAIKAMWKDGKKIGNVAGQLTGDTSFDQKLDRHIIGMVLAGARTGRYDSQLMDLYKSIWNIPLRKVGDYMMKELHMSRKQVKVSGLQIESADYKYKWYNNLTAKPLWMYFALTHYFDTDSDKMISLSESKVVAQTVVFLGEDRVRAEVVVTLTLKGMNPLLGFNNAVRHVDVKILNLLAGKVSETEVSRNPDKYMASRFKKPFPNATFTVHTDFQKMNKWVLLSDEYAYKGTHSWGEPNFESPDRNFTNIQLYNSKVEAEKAMKEIKDYVAAATAKGEKLVLLTKYILPSLRVQLV